MHLVHVMQSPTVSPGPVPCSASDSPTSGTPPCRVPAASGRVLLVFPHLPSGKSASRTRMAFGQLAEASSHMANQHTWSGSTSVDEDASKTEVICPVSPRPGILRIARLVSDTCCF
ncbi:uncharacterized protein CCOS01_11036 [Colletotrichum costaricense]|uniref:Uncharacterized protein n=1 Tax=Colletotrichum costaricense TaxID=1209916 RepID=A0AAJ0DWX3_9PEZI|nr:uncharacterized protein CCOS01_11036 [Colletotrichum costaricense]KAK1519385.1 hypothetical protein CCOS01_11036 [Colletotrichum costaricense]